MKKGILVLAGLILTGTMVTTTASANGNGAHRTTTSSIINAEGGTFKNSYYRVNKATKVNLMFYRKTDNQEVKKSVTLPKGTVIASSPIDQWKTNIQTGRYTTDLSYHLKREVVSKLGKDYYGQGVLRFEFRPSSRFTRIKRPAGVLPYGNGTLIKGGLAAIKQLPQITTDSVKLTSDGYLEYYKYNGAKYEDIAGDSFWNTKPTNYRKIRHVLVKGSKTYLYYSSKMPNVNDKQVRKSGPYKYRLTINNKHTPYFFTDNSQGDDTGFASIYTVGGTAYATRVGQGFN